MYLIDQILLETITRSVATNTNVHLVSSSIIDTECRLVRKNINCCPLEITSHKSEVCLWKRAKIYFFSVKCWRNLCLRNILTPKVDTFVNRKACKKFPLPYDFLSPVGYICILCKEVVCGNCNLETQTFFFLLWENSFSRDFRHSNLFCLESFSTKILISTSTILRTCE